SSGCPRRSPRRSPCWNTRCSSTRCSCGSSRHAISIRCAGPAAGETARSTTSRHRRSAGASGPAPGPTSRRWWHGAAAPPSCPWPAAERLVARGCRPAILPLGSTEQHGPHLPLDTDTVIGDALAERLCAAVDDAVACPTLPLGCTGEHLGFPGTLHVEPATLA